MGWLSRKVEYVPIPAFGRYVDLWENKNYLQDAANVAETKPYVVEVTQLISDMREKADSADSVEALKAYNDCIRLTKSLLTLRQKAKLRLEDVLYKEKMEKDNAA
jgi:hypothetical protein